MFNLLKNLLMVIGLGTALAYSGTWGKTAVLWASKQMMELAIDAQKHQMSYAWFDQQLNQSHRKEGKH